MSYSGLRGMCLLLLAIFGGLGSEGALADEAKVLALGRHLARECTACHRIDGVDNGIPSITGLETEYFLETMDFYRNAARPNQVMISVAQSLGDDELRALALYYGSLPKATRQKR
jgi:cytochrome c553